MSRYSSIIARRVNDFETVMVWLDNQGSPYFLLDDTPEVRALAVMDEYWFFPPEWRVSRSYANHAAPPGTIAFYRGDLVHAGKRKGGQ